VINSLEEFRSLGIEFVSIHEGVDTSTPNGRLIFVDRPTIKERHLVARVPMLLYPAWSVLITCEDSTKERFTGRRPVALL
jgi:hypothetical protein